MTPRPSLWTALFICKKHHPLRPCVGIMPGMFSRWQAWLERAILLGVVALLLSTSVPRLPDLRARAAMYVDGLTFDFNIWTVRALWFKAQQASMGLPGYLSRVARKQAVDDYFRLTEDALRTEAALNDLYSDPRVTDPQADGALLRARLDALRRDQARVQILAESVLEAQIAAVLAQEGLTFLGQPLPPVLAHITPLPYDLVISPRDRIEQVAAFMLRPDLTADDFERLEARVDADLGVSSLVVPVGGVGTYPTMVQRTASLSWTVQTFAHEWTHNYLNWHPLGLRYDRTPALRTMNETTASIAGEEIGVAVLRQFYPERVPLAQHGEESVAWLQEHPDPRDWPRPVFDAREELHRTRVRVDALLDAGEVEAAETYMEVRRQFFWLMGLRLRKLNQAYFAFYGAYAAAPGGAAGADPVGPAVRTLRERSPSLGAFVRAISRLHSFAELQSLLENPTDDGGTPDETLAVVTGLFAPAGGMQPLNPWAGCFADGCADPDLAADADADFWRILPGAARSAYPSPR